MFFVMLTFDLRVLDLLHELVCEVDPAWLVAVTMQV
jgi:hypothetical protein